MLGVGAVIYPYIQGLKHRLNPQSGKTHTLIQQYISKIPAWENLVNRFWTPLK